MFISTNVLLLLTTDRRFWAGTVVPGIPGMAAKVLLDEEAGDVGGAVATAG